MAIGIGVNMYLHVISPFEPEFHSVFHIDYDMASLAALQTLISDPAYHEYLAIVKGARNGLVYGAKVRFPHALVMAILFGRGE